MRKLNLENFQNAATDHFVNYDTFLCEFPFFFFQNVTNLVGDIMRILVFLFKMLPINLVGNNLWILIFSKISKSAVWEFGVDYDQFWSILFNVVIGQLICELISLQISDPSQATGHDIFNFLKFKLVANLKF